MPKYKYVILMSALIVCLGCTHAQSGQKASKICFNEQCVEAELAQTFEEVSKGLMFREHLDTNHGMLFIFPNSEPRTFWMKNTLIPLDIVWIDENKKIVQVSENVPPCDFDPCPRHPSKDDVRFVLEINAGELKMLNWKVGDVLSF